MDIAEILAEIRSEIKALRALIESQKVEKEWYTTDELAKALGKAQWTVQEKWCNRGRIDCEKDPDTGKWRIPGSEFRRLVKGGSLRPLQTVA